jgi:hypothetical protein
MHPYKCVIFLTEDKHACINVMYLIFLSYNFPEHARLRTRV